MSTYHPSRALVKTPAAIAFCVLLLLLVVPGPAASGTVPGPAAPTGSAAADPAWGVYAGPGAKGVTGARAFAGATGINVTRVLDFLPYESWDALTKVDWLIDAYRGPGYQLELSVPMIPRSGNASLGACAAGHYDKQWTTIAAKLVAAGLGKTTVRPGWEANGSWYVWSAKGKEEAYVGCFRSLVTAMRRVAPALTFSWTVNNGANVLAGERIWPGSAYVDVVGVDAYDQDWYWYPVRPGSTLSIARDQAWRNTLDGSRGLAYWARFARSYGKPLALSEWGLAWRADGHGGLDDVAFVDRIVAFVRDPANNVAYATYFNNVDSARLARNLTRPATRFPEAGRRLSVLTRT